MNFTNREQIGQFLNYHNLKNIGVELGSFKGQFANTILNNWNGKLLMVDVWRELPHEEYDDASNHREHIDAYSQAMDNLKGFEDRAYMLRMKGEHACDFILDGSLDFVYIDANHTYNAVKEDINLWYPKVKSGGIVMGHDYLPDYFYEGKEEKDQALNTFPDGQPEKAQYTGMFGVNPAVDEFCKENGYTINKTDEFLATWWFIKK
jgi:predicted O-methyltransferase YrrM